MKRPDNQEEEFEWIEQYLRGQMTEVERVFFENECHDDPNLKQEMENIKWSQRQLQDVFLQQRVQNNIRHLQAADRRKIKVIQLVKYAGYLAAACVAFIIFLSFSPADFPDSENDFNVVRSANETSMSPQQRKIFNEFFEGQAYMAEGAYALSIPHLEKVLQYNDLRPYFKEATQWHLAVAYLKSGDIARAEQLYKQFNHCLDCEYKVSQIDRWRIWWQIKTAKIFK